MRKSRWIKPHNLFSTPGNKQCSKLQSPQRTLQLETLETRNLFYANPLSPELPETPVMVGETSPPPHTRTTIVHQTNKPNRPVLGPEPERFLTPKQSRPSELDLELPPVAEEPIGVNDRLFPLGKPTPPNRFVPTPVGLFPDGSVRPIHPDISPIVVEHMDNNGTGPMRDTLHRPRVGLGAPVGSLAGTDPRLLEYMTLEENWHAAEGPLVHSIQTLEISPDNLLMEVPQIYEMLERFSRFDDGNIATVAIHEPGVLDSPMVAGQRFGVFTVNIVSDTMLTDPFWSLLNTLQLMVNEPSVAVRIHNVPQDHEIFAVTLEKHMLVGARIWRVYQQDSGWVRIETEAWEQRNGVLNDVAAEVAGRAAMEEIWTRYLHNLGEAASRGTGRFHKLPGKTSIHPENRTNPWRIRADKYRQTLQLPPPLTTLPATRK